MIFLCMRSEKGAFDLLRARNIFMINPVRKPRRKLQNAIEIVRIGFVLVSRNVFQRNNQSVFMILCILSMNGFFLCNFV